MSKPAYNVALSPSSLLDARALASMQQLDANAHNYHDMRSAKNALMSYISSLAAIPDNTLEQNLGEWQDLLNHQLDSASKPLNEQSRELFKKIVYILINDDSLDRATKIEIINELYSPLSFCTAGADGQIQSMFMLLESNSLFGQVRLFAKYLAEKMYVDTKNDSIHIRNQYLYAASLVLPIIGKMEQDPYGNSQYSEAFKTSLLKKYTIENLLEFIESKVSYVIAGSKLKFGNSPGDLDKIIKNLKFIDITKEEIDNLFLIKLKGSYGEWSDFLKNILIAEFSDYDYYASYSEMPANRKTDHVYIVQTVDGFELLVNDQKFEISIKNIEEYKKMLDFVSKKPKQDLSLLYDVINSNDENKPSVMINKNFTRYKIFQGLKNIKMLISDNEQKQEWQDLAIKLNDSIQYTLYLCKDQCELFFTDVATGKYLTFADVLYAHGDSNATKELFLEKSRNDGFPLFIDDQYGVDNFFQYNADLIKLFPLDSPLNDKIIAWLSNNPLFFDKWLKHDEEEVKNFLDKLNYKQDCQFFSSQLVQDKMQNKDTIFFRKYFLDSLLPRLGENDLAMFFKYNTNKNDEYFYLLKLCILSKWLSLPQINGILLHDTVINDEDFTKQLKSSDDAYFFDRVILLRYRKEDLIEKMFNLQRNMYYYDDEDVIEGHHINIFLLIFLSIVLAACLILQAPIGVLIGLSIPVTIMFIFVSRFIIVRSNTESELNKATADLKECNKDKDKEILIKKTAQIIERLVKPSPLILSSQVSGKNDVKFSQTQKNADDLNIKKPRSN